MNHHLYTRKIQIQDVKSSVKGLFTEEDNQNDVAQSGEDKLSQAITDTSHRETITLPQRLGHSLKKYSLRYKEMYRGEENFEYVTSYFSRLANFLRSGQALRSVQYAVQKHVFDRSFENLLFKSSYPEKKSITTGGSAELGGKGLQPAPVSLLKTILSHLPDPLNHFHFINIGSGAGRALLVASCYPFRKVLGIEHTKELHEIGRSNIAHFPRSRMLCRDVQCHWQEATSLELPGQKAIFLFNAPFSTELYQEMIEKITHSYKETPRRLYLIFIEAPDSKKLDRIIEQSHVYEQFHIPALQSWKTKWLNPCNVRVYRSIFREKG